jgi:hypothetical protein
MADYLEEEDVQHFLKYDLVWRGVLDIAVRGLPIAEANNSIREAVAHLGTGYSQQLIDFRRAIFHVPEQDTLTLLDGTPVYFAQGADYYTLDLTELYKYACAIWLLSSGLTWSKQETMYWLRKCARESLKLEKEKVTV